MMLRTDTARVDADRVMDELKDFQRESVDYVIRRLYDDPDRVSRFLISDEVGLGKTLVARGVIAQAVERLWDSVERIDVLYICSNQAIARQNVDRLNIAADRKFQLSSRATLLPIALQELRGNKLNFVSFTPGTSFDLRSSGGIIKERWVLYELIKQAWEIPDSSLQNVMRGNAGRPSWRSNVAWFRKYEKIDSELSDAFLAALSPRKELRKRLQTLASEIGPRLKHIPDDLRQERDLITGELRRLLAHTSLSALEPDIIILDEFQRFRYLLDPEDPMSALAQELFTYQDAKVLLLSATPYKMYSLEWETDEDHYADFLRTMEFLFDGKDELLRHLKSALETYRLAYLEVQETATPECIQARRELEQILRKVMVRTERLAVSSDRNGMLMEVVNGKTVPSGDDLKAYVHLDQVAQELGEGNPIEFWKSSAYPLNLMEGYKLGSRLEKAVEDDEPRDLPSLVADAKRHLLSWGKIQRYEPIDPQNARMRDLFESSIESGNWRLLWVPPSLPYYAAGRAFASNAREGMTKSLVFSAWRIVPKVIAMLASYEAERLMLARDAQGVDYSDLNRKRGGLLEYKRSKGKPAGMSVFTITYPCLTLAHEVDPLLLACEATPQGGPLPDQQALLALARKQVADLLARATHGFDTVVDGPVDERWYWAAPVLLDRHFHRAALEAWLSVERWVDDPADPTVRLADDKEATALLAHYEVLGDALDTPHDLGRMPEDLVDVLSWIALASPAAICLRSLLRIADGDTSQVHAAFMSAAEHCGLAFRTLFNLPESTGVVKRARRAGPYWRKVLAYCLDGNLQAVMDEHVHILRESLGLAGHSPEEIASKIADEIYTALSLRSPTLRFDELTQRNGSIALTRRGIRCRYALRFGDEGATDDDGAARSTEVRIAFNSPFRPFILATTSIGQEGLDFHQYCHRVVHWNLPSNPVDLEQREGRVHRYKGHVIRRNLAKHYGLPKVEKHNGIGCDPWRVLFERAEGDRPGDANDLVPYWIFETEGGQKIERHVPMLPLSREIGRLEWLKKTLVAYRSVIGQPRQEELLASLATRLQPEQLERLTQSLAIDLSPPHSESSK